MPRRNVRWKLFRNSAGARVYDPQQLRYPQSAPLFVGLMSFKLLRVIDPRSVRELISTSNFESRFCGRSWK